MGGMVSIDKTGSTATQSRLYGFVKIHLLDSGPLACMPSSVRGGDWRDDRSSSAREASCGERRRPINRAGYWDYPPRVPIWITHLGTRARPAPRVPVWITHLGTWSRSACRVPTKSSERGALLLSPFWRGLRRAVPARVTRRVIHTRCVIPTELPVGMWVVFGARK